MLSSLRTTPGNRTRRLASTFVATVIALTACAALGAVAGCAQEGTTPQCENNVTKDGILIKPKNPCESFGQCFINGAPHAAADCCVDDKGDPLTGSSLTQCLYGFGEVDLDTGGGGAGGTGGSTGGSGGTT